MASATGIPNDPVVREATGADDMEPLLGRPGDASQPERAPIWKNLIIGKDERLPEHLSIRRT